ncbi:hypothetical protein K505DRAFT_341002 [Melanomma pulvis-pyrius CBS 109.77]|uniref:Uncharacterized protein n=1 Tax=Melanomma pulvis-pyrius CBS 109.77 TaxID=1314802 RepID=A0A6A6X072_9PLEO|nr:hypothetical protein K505DRAFT_341002 [Melanomma pulvis-pyrius CBS 109.77]
MSLALHEHNRESTCGYLHHTKPHVQPALKFLWLVDESLAYSSPLFSGPSSFATHEAGTGIGTQREIGRWRQCETAARSMAITQRGDDPAASGTVASSHCLHWETLQLSNDRFRLNCFALHCANRCFIVPEFHYTSYTANNYPPTLVYPLVSGGGQKFETA